MAEPGKPAETQPWKKAKLELKKPKDEFEAEEAHQEEAGDGQQEEAEGGQQEEDQAGWSTVVFEEGEEEEEAEEDPIVDGEVISSTPAPWAPAPRHVAMASATEKGHCANSDRPQKVEGTAWVTSTGQKVWTHASSGQTFKNLGFIILHVCFPSRRRRRRWGEGGGWATT